MTTDRAGECGLGGAGELEQVGDDLICSAIVGSVRRRNLAHEGPWEIQGRKRAYESIVVDGGEQIKVKSGQVGSGQVQVRYVSPM